MSPSSNSAYKLCFGDFPTEEAMITNESMELEENSGTTVLQQLDKSENEYVESSKCHISSRENDLKIDKFDEQTSKIYTIEMVECSLCKKLVPENSLPDHILKEHCTKQTLDCELCDFVCSTRDALRYHSVKVHKDISFPCDLCKKSFKDLDSHVKYFHDKKRNFKCSYCEKAFQVNRLLDNHVKSVHHGTQINCPECNKNVSIDNFTRHRKEKHDKVKKPCPQCEKEFGMSNLSRHIKSVHNDESTKCPECDKSYSLYNLSHHIRNIHREQKKTCDICNKIVPAANVSAHKRRVHNIGRDINDVIPRGPNHKLRKRSEHSDGTTCKSCAFSCVKRTTMMKHVNKKHGYNRRNKTLIFEGTTE